MTKNLENRFKWLSPVLPTEFIYLAQQADERCETVYHCKSDTEALGGDDNIVISTTSFTDVPLTFTVIYGCTEKVMEDTKGCIQRCEAAAFHPLMLPMIFAEHERKRFIQAIDKRSTELDERVIELKKRLKPDTEEELRKCTEKVQTRKTMSERDCEAIELWRSLSSLKNGLECLYTELGSMADHAVGMQKSLPKHESDSRGFHRANQGPEVHIEARLKEMRAELRSKTRGCESLLGSMKLAAQMVRSLLSFLPAN